jgi:hypothetical protein
MALACEPKLVYGLLMQSEPAAQQDQVATTEKPNSVFQECLISETSLELS